MNTKTLIATLALAGFAAATQANVIDFSANGNNNALGTTSTFTQGGISITAYGFGPSSAVNLYSKNQGGGGENGLGLVNDPAAQNEITVGSFIQLGLPTTPATLVNLVLLESNTLQESATIWWSTTLGSLGSQIGTVLASADGTGNFTLPALYANGTGYLGISAGSGNVLLGALDVTPRSAPDGGATLILLGSAMSAIGLIRRKLVA
jgi:hypothetical protein